MKSRNLIELSSLGVISVFLSIYGYWVIDGFLGQGAHHRPFRSLELIVSSIAVFALVLLLYRMFSIRLLYALAIVGSGFYVFAFPYFAATDEAGHFAYVDHIARNHSIPTVRDYVSSSVLAMEEHVYPKSSQRDPTQIGLRGLIYVAMHPPLYYLLASLVYQVIPGNLIHKFYVLRGLGVVALFCFIFSLIRCYRRVIWSRFASEEPFLFFAVLSLFTLTPGVLLRVSLVSNFQLTLILSVLFYSSICWLCSNSREIRRCDAVGLGVLTGVSIVTHIFSVTLMLLALFLFCFRKAYVRIFEYSVAVLCISLPWFIFNYFQYGAWTGWGQVYDLILNVQNPGRVSYDISTIIEQLVPKFSHTFWNPEECRQIFPLADLCSKYLSGLLLLGILTIAFFELRKIFRKERVAILDCIMILGIALNFGLLVYLGFKQSLPTLLGRHMYLSLFPLIYISYRFFSFLSKDYQKIFGLSLLACAVVLWINFLVQIVAYRLAA